MEPWPAHMHAQTWNLDQVKMLCRVYHTQRQFGSRSPSEHLLPLASLTHSHPCRQHLDAHHAPGHCNDLPSFTEPHLQGHLVQATYTGPSTVPGMLAFQVMLARFPPRELIGQCYTRSTTLISRRPDNSILARCFPGARASSLGLKSDI